MDRYKSTSLTFTMLTVKKSDKYELITYNENSDLEKRKDIGKLINIYEGKLNEIGRYSTALSYNWFRKEPETMIEILSNNMYNYFRHINRELLFLTI